MEKLFLHYDDYDGDTIFGSREGLLELQKALNECLKEGSSEVTHEGLTWLKIELKNSLDKPEPLSIGGKLKYSIGSILIGTWLLVLPLIAIGFLLTHLFASEDYSNCDIAPEYLAPLPKVIYDTP